ncbi:hypothetical protein NDU88_001031 [Pleurodeles waltl]|uniref:Uncharacterized protein n=1 Tax=Pleurodeles waltl TaxID=8319 RepID=A0AAV7VAQ7_PLEWA|nr:hypothetical protein NDU88_001031 [Pleurodeles waltl]
MRLRVPVCIYGEQGFRGQCVGGEGFMRGRAVVGSGQSYGAVGAWGQYGGGGDVDRFHTDTSDLSWQEVAGQSGDDPGDHGATQRPWGEEKAGHRAASWMASSVEGSRTHGATDAPWGQCEVRGCAPTGVAFPGEQHPGTSGGDRGLRAAPAAKSKHGELHQWIGKEPVT